MELEKYILGIKKTGFLLENKIAQALKKQGWNVISNKYYEDDFEEKIREIDLLAYKVSKVQDFDVYTCLIISCKKNEQNVWALSCRDVDLKDPNSDFWPLHCWSNKPSLIYQLSNPETAKKYYKDLKNSGVKEALADPNVDIFAFQEMDANNGSPKNDKAIYDSFTSLIKAQSYEINALPERKKAPCIYQFNLISIVDAEVVKLKFNGSEITPSITLSEHYVSRYILKKRQSFSKIRIISASIFEQSIKDYNKLHKENSNWFNYLCNDFYSKIEEDSKKLSALIKEFRSELHSTLKSRYYQLTHKVIDRENIYLYWDAEFKTLGIDFNNELPDIEDLLKDDIEVKRIISKALKKVYRYEGSLRIGFDIPF